MDQQDSKHTIDIDLIGRYLSGEATAEEVIWLEDWISFSSTNKLLFDQYMATWNGLQVQDTYQLPARSEAWSRLNQSVAEMEKSRGVKKLLLRYPIAAVIAGIAILSIIPLIFFMNKGGNDLENIQTFTTKSGISTNSLPDGSSIILNSNSSIRFPDKFRPDERDAELDGEAYFSIVPDPLRPFRIHFKGITIQVLGTSFNVRENLERNVIETQVSTGKVKMFNSNGEVSIDAGQTGIYDKLSNSFAVEQTLDLNSFSYATRNFVFSDEELGSIVKYLEKAYSKTIVLKNVQIGRCKMTSSFNNKSIEYILDVISTTLGVTYTIKGNAIYIEGGDHEGC